MLQSLEEYITDWHWTDVFQAFLPDGRSSRFQYAVGMLLGMASIVAAVFSIQYLFNFSMSANDTSTFVTLTILTVFAMCKIAMSIFLMLMLNVKRLHDINESGLWTCLLMIPALGVILVIFLLLAPGYVFRNQYGSPPA